MAPTLSELAGSSATESSSGGTGGSGNGRDVEDWPRFDTSDRNWTKQFPQTAVRFTAQQLVWQPDFEQDDDGNYIPQDTGNFNIVGTDATIVVDDETYEDQVIVVGSGSGDDYRVYNPDDDATEIDEDSGRVIFGSNSIFSIDGVVDGEEFPVDEIVSKYGGVAGERVARALDVKGRGGAHAVGYYEGQDIELHEGGFPRHSGHLFEYNPDDDDESRPSRDPELRPDVEGRDVIVMLNRASKVNPDYDGDAYHPTVLANLTDERTEELTERYAENANQADDDVEKEPEDYVTEVDGDTFVLIQPTDEFEPSEANLYHEGFIQWRRVGDTDAINEARVEAGLDEYDFDD